MAEAMVRAHIRLHTSVLLFGGAALFGPLVSISTAGIVFGRTLVAALFLLATTPRLQRPPQWHQIRSGIPAGMLLAFHWYAFFAAVRTTGVSCGVLSFSTFPLFTIGVEALVYKTPVRLSAIGVSLAILMGIFWMFPAGGFHDPKASGIVWGIASGFSFALLSVWNKRTTTAKTAADRAFFQNGFAALSMGVFLLLAHKPLFAFLFSPKDALGIIALGIFCTGLAHTWFLGSMTTLSATTAAITAGLEPVYATFLAWIFLGQIPAERVWWGGAWILAAVLFHAGTCHENPAG